MKTLKFRSKNLNSRLAAYSATATAAMLIVPAAKADIQNITIADLYSGSTQGVVPQVSFNSHSGGLSFKAGPLNASFFNEVVGMGYVGLSGRFAAVGNLVNKLASGATIVGLQFPNSGFHTLKNGLGPLNGVSTNYVGFKTHKNAQTYYGWLRVQLAFDSNGKPETLKLLSKNGSPDIFGAYGSKQAGDNVWAGIVATPEPSVAALGGLALLACGVAGVREMRRRRQTETVKAE